MRQIRTSGSEGGGCETNRFSLPLSEDVPRSSGLELWMPTFAGKAAVEVKRRERDVSIL